MLQVLALNRERAYARWKEAQAARRAAAEQLYALKRKRMASSESDDNDDDKDDTDFQPSQYRRIATEAGRASTQPDLSSAAASAQSDVRLVPLIVVSGSDDDSDGGSNDSGGDGGDEGSDDSQLSRASALKRNMQAVATYNTIDKCVAALQSRLSADEPLLTSGEASARRESAEACMAYMRAHHRRQTAMQRMVAAYEHQQYVALLTTSRDVAQKSAARFRRAMAQIMAEPQDGKIPLDEYTARDRATRYLTMEDMARKMYWCVHMVSTIVEDMQGTAPITMRAIKKHLAERHCAKDPAFSWDAMHHGQRKTLDNALHVGYTLLTVPWVFYAYTNGLYLHCFSKDLFSVKAHMTTVQSQGHMVLFAHSLGLVDQATAAQLTRACNAAHDSLVWSVDVFLASNRPLLGGAASAVAQDHGKAEDASDEGVSAGGTSSDDDEADDDDCTAAASGGWCDARDDAAEACTCAADPIERLPLSVLGPYERAEPGYAVQVLIVSADLTEADRAAGVEDVDEDGRGALIEGVVTAVHGGDGAGDAISYDILLGEFPAKPVLRFRTVYPRRQRALIVDRKCEDFSVGQVVEWKCKTDDHEGNQIAYRWYPGLVHDTAVGKIGSRRRRHYVINGYNGLFDVLPEDVRSPTDLRSAVANDRFTPRHDLRRLCSDHRNACNE